MKKLMNKIYSPAMLSLCTFCLSIFSWAHSGKHSFLFFGEPEYKEN